MAEKEQVLEIEGGQVPSGRVRVSGAKNSALKLASAALLTDDLVHLDNFPTELNDIRIKLDFMKAIGCEIASDSSRNEVDIKSGPMTSQELDSYQFPIRTTYLLVPGQLRKHGIARIPYPGGCNIGQRKYDLHIMVWEALGCTVRETENHIEVRCDRLRPAEINFPISTVGGTESALLCAAVTEGETVIRNAYVTPEIFDIVLLLQAMGVQVDVHGNSYIKVCGSQRLRGASVSVMPDRIEALTWIIYSLLAKGSVLIEDVPFDSMEVPFIHLKEAGVDIFRNTRDVYVGPTCFRSTTIQPFEMACGTYPGVISDMQPFFVLLGLFGNGRSRIIDYRYPERTAYIDELNKLCGGRISAGRGEITMEGPLRIAGTDVVSTDLRGSMALILAGLLGEGTTRVQKPSMALRGYNNLLGKLEGLGIRARLL